MPEDHITNNKIFHLIFPRYKFHIQICLLFIIPTLIIVMFINLLLVCWTNHTVYFANQIYSQKIQKTRKISICTQNTIKIECILYKICTAGCQLRPCPIWFFCPWWYSEGPMVEPGERNRQLNKRAKKMILLSILML